MSKSLELSLGPFSWYSVLSRNNHNRLRLSRGRHSPGQSPHKKSTGTGIGQISQRLKVSSPMPKKNSCNHLSRHQQIPYSNQKYLPPRALPLWKTKNKVTELELLFCRIRKVDCGSRQHQWDPVRSVTYPLYSVVERELIDNSDMQDISLADLIPISREAISLGILNRSRCKVTTS